MLKEIIIAIQGYYKAHHFIREHKLWKWIIIPGIIYTVLFVVSMYFFGLTANSFIEWLSLKTGLKTWLDKNGTGFLGFLFAFGGVMLWVIQMLFYFSLFKYIWLIVGSPVFAYLSEKTASITENKEFVFNSNQFIKDVFRGIKIALRNCLWQSVYMISILLLSLIPIVGWLMPLLAVLVECYYYGFSMLDYSFERKKITASESIYFIGNHKGIAIGNGLMFYMIQLLPVVGWVLAPAYAVVAATLSLHQIKELLQVKAQ
ncbi:MAG: EI24 domain-containing protein [Parafilimonas sp.]|nr:EI24 domain-containing protein [Parafilimonas sp.]